MKQRLLTLAVLALLTAGSGIALSATADAEVQAAVELAKAPQGSQQFQQGIAQLTALSAQGNGLADLEMGHLSARLSRTDPAAYPVAVAEYQRAMDRQTPGAELALAKLRFEHATNAPSVTEAGQAELRLASEGFVNLAANGDPEAQWYLGFMKTRGMLEKGQYAQGVELIRLAGAAGHKMAAYWTAAHLAQVGSEKDLPERIRFLEIAAAKGHSFAKQDLAQLRPEPTMSQRVASVAQGGFSTVSEMLSKGVVLAAAGTGPQHAQQLTITTVTTAAPAINAAHEEVARARIELDRTRYELADANRQIATLESRLAAQPRLALSQNPQLLNQQGLDAVLKGDYETALLKFRESAKFDHPGAIANLGLLHLNGTSVPQDGRQAIALFARATDLGNVTAAENAGRAYDFGIGINPDRSRAITWYERAQRMGSQHASAAIIRLRTNP